MMSMALAAQTTLGDWLETATSGVWTAFGDYTLLGFGMVAVLGYLAWKYRPSIASMLFVSALVMAVLGGWGFISKEIIYSALIITGIIAGIGVGRMVGAI